MADVVLIYPYFYTHARDAMLFHPLGIAQLTALLRRRGLDVSVVDCTFRSRDHVLVDIEENPPRIVGVYAMVSISANACAMAGDLRNHLPDVALVCGGPLPTVRPEQFAGVFDLVFRGEADRSFPRFCRDYVASGLHLRDFLSSRKSLACYPGLYGHEPDAGPVFQTPVKSSEAEDFNRLPIPDRTDYDHRCYQSFWMERGEVWPATIMTTYGCPYGCEFCSRPIFGRVFRRRNMGRIFEEVRTIKESGYNGLWIGDDCFTLDLEHVRAFCRRVIEEKVEMKWSCLSRVDTISAEDVALMGRAGCWRVYLGLESGDNGVLKMMNKRATVEAADRTVRLFSETGIETSGFFMVGYPGETCESIEKTFAWSLSLPLDELSFSIPYPLPGTPLIERVVGVNAASDWTYENENQFVYESEFDADYLKRRIEETHVQFTAQRQSSRR